MSYVVELKAVRDPTAGRRTRRAIPKTVKKVKTLKEAQRVVQSYINRHNLTGGTWAGGKVTKNGRPTHYISYNGRVWDWKDR